MTILKNKAIILLVGLVTMISGLNGMQQKRTVRFQDEETPLQQMGNGLKIVGKGLKNLPGYSVEGGAELVVDINAQAGYAPMFLTTLAGLNSIVCGFGFTSKDPSSLMSYTSESLHDSCKKYVNIFAQALIDQPSTVCLYAGCVGLLGGALGYAYKAMKRPWHLPNAGPIRATVGLVGSLAVLAGLGAMTGSGVPAVAQPVVQAS